MGDIEKICPRGSVLCRQYPWIFRGREPIWRNGLQCDYPPSGEQPFNPWSGVSGENINSTPAQIPEEKNTNVRVIFMDKQFETPLSSRSNSPHSETSFTTLFPSLREELNSSPPSFPYLCLSRSGSLRLGNGALPAAGKWSGPTSGLLDFPTTGLETPPFFFSPPLSHSLASTDSSSPPKFLKQKFIRRTL